MYVYIFPYPFSIFDALFDNWLTTGKTLELFFTKSYFPKLVNTSSQFFCPATFHIIILVLIFLFVHGLVDVREDCSLRLRALQDVSSRSTRQGWAHRRLGTRRYGRYSLADGEWSAQRCGRWCETRWAGELQLGLTCATKSIRVRASIESAPPFWPTPNM